MVREILHQTSGLLEKGNFRIRKWCSNAAEVLEGIRDEDKESFLKYDDGTNFTKALGLAWDPATDKLLFSFSPTLPSSKATKRSVLSSITRFYDPLGLIGPVIAKAKIFMQTLRKEKLDWDESLPLEHSSIWKLFCNNLLTCHRFSFTHLAVLSGSNIVMHGFCDANTIAYGACIYIVSRTSANVESQLVCSKSRVAPVKPQTVPKLELCAALLAHLIRDLIDLNIFVGRFYCWSESSIVLLWIRNVPANFYVFVSHRVGTIQDKTSNAEWRYVSTAQNPADILSRGAFSTELIGSDFWTHGPTFLCKDKEEWPLSCLPDQQLQELRKGVLIAACPHGDFTANSKFINNFGKLQRTFAYVFKFVHRSKSPGLTVEDILGGTQLLLRSVQQVHSNSDYQHLINGKPVTSSSQIASLYPFIDEFGLLRVGGRLRNSLLDFNARHPHAGPRALLAIIRQQYWPIGGRKTVTAIVNKCTTCFRAKPRLLEHIMADMPKERVTDTSHAFMITGVDFCGPFYYKNTVRTRPPVKCYVCLFICVATKAVHLELVDSLSIASFLSALKRFIFTRGRPKEIWSDNATNFVGARNELADLKRLTLSDEHQMTVKKFCIAEDINWRFIPPRSPHFGGLWEAAIKTAKHHFYRAVKNSLLSLDELRTLFCHISAVINSRPLLPISEHPDDIDVLTPAHFLGIAPFSSFAEPDITKLNFDRLNRWQRVSYMQQTFWARWKEEYITLLQQRAKWRNPQSAISIGDIVLVKNENLPPLKWPLARVNKLIAGKDGVARVAELKIAAGLITRAIAKLCLLPKKDVESPCLSTGGECSAKRLCPAGSAAATTIDHI